MRVCRSPVYRGLGRKLRITPIVNPNRRFDAKVGEGYGLGRALLIEAVTAVAAVVFAVREGKGGTASHAYIRIDPLGWLWLREITS